MAKSWNHDRASDHIERKLKDVETVTILDYRRDMSLECRFPLRFDPGGW